MGDMDIAPVFGSAQTYFFPAVLVILSLFNVFEVYGKVLESFGL